jgi:hypothetical protein
MRRDLWRRAGAWLLVLLLCLGGAALGEETPAYLYEKTGDGTDYDSPTLRYSIEVGLLDGTKVYVSRIWMADPGRQILKAGSPWHKKLAEAEELAKQLPQAGLIINGSGYVSPLYPDIPANYPGTSADYYYTPLGSLAVTNGELLRNLEGVPFCGLTLEADGLHMYRGADNAEVLARNPTQTWCFYEQCPLIEQGAGVLDRDWDFAKRKAIRTVIAKVDDHNYVVLTATSVHGLTLMSCTDFLLGEFHPEWAYNLDGGPSSALLRRRYGKKGHHLVYGGRQKIVDVMGFAELPIE